MGLVAFGRESRPEYASDDSDHSVGPSFGRRGGYEADHDETATLQRTRAALARANARLQALGEPQEEP